MHKKTLIVKLLGLLTLMLFIGAFWSLGMSEAGQAQIQINPDKGPPGTKLSIMGTGFVPQEKVKVILHVGVIQLQLATENSGGFNEVNQDGTFKLDPSGGIPVAPTIVKPGIYKVEASGNMGSFADTQLEILKKNNRIH